jgi:hypothetical protein
MKRLIVPISVAAVLIAGGVAMAATTGNDNGHGDHGCHTGEKNNDLIINHHCKTPSPSPSVLESSSPSPSVSPSPSETPEATPTPSASPSPSVQLPTVLPDTGGHGTL